MSKFDAVSLENATLEERFNALEQQSYFMYLQLNAITTLLVDKQIIPNEELGKAMDNIHNHVTEVVEKIAAEEKEKDNVKEEE